MSKRLYTGDVVFVEGVHYPVDKDGEPDLSRPLRWTEDGYRAAADDEPLHNDVNHVRELELDPGGEG